MIPNDLFRRDGNPCVLEPRVPPIFGINAVGHFDLELRFDGVCDAAAEARFGITILMLVVVRTLEALEPSLVGTVWPFTAGEPCSRKRKTYCRGQDGHAKIQLHNDPHSW